MLSPAWRSRADLTARDGDRHRIDGAIRSGAYSSPARGVLLPSDCCDDLWQRCGAVLSTQRADAAIARRTAAVAHEFAWLPDAWGSVDVPISVNVDRDDVTRSARRGLDRRIAALPPEDIALWKGLRITTPARTAVDLARYESHAVALPVLDWLLTQQICSREELLAVLDRMVRVPHVRRARQRVELARCGVASPRETHTRLHILGAGLPEPDVNLLIVVNGLVIAQGDLGYWRWLIWIEYDGEEFHLGRRMSGDDQSKDRWLKARGWDVYRITNRDHYAPGAFLEQLRHGIAEAPARIAAMDPRRSPELAEAHRLLGLPRRS
ncbi:MAG: hypothetical protein QOF18_2981 [Frankiaceae bacterium]|nr:hypothetical protein [Frankiaceae bacterium]